MLREALVALLMERGWDGVSVQDVCARADVGRSTFYMHFADKEDLLVGGFADLRKALRGQLAKAPTAARPLGFARGLIEHAHENQRLFRALVGKRSGQVVLAQFRELVLDLVREDLGALPARETTVHFVAGAFLELLTWWLDARTSLTPEDVEHSFMKMAGAALQAARR